MLTNLELDELALNPAFRSLCPTCHDTGTYRFQGEDHECPDSHYGHTQFRLHQLFALANIPKDYQKLDWDEFPLLDVKAKVDHYIDHFNTIFESGLGWEIYGKNLGVGKTWVAAHMAKRIVQQGYETWFVAFFDLLNLNDDPDQRSFVLKKIRRAQLLVIDDIKEPHTERQSNFFESVLEPVIRFRTSNNLPTITTTNMVEEDMRQKFSRVYSLLSAKQIRQELAGEDYRIWSAYEKTEAILLGGEVVPIYE